MKERLQKIISQAGIASRRNAENLILQGRVCVNGNVVTQLGVKADTGVDTIVVDGQVLDYPENHVYILLNKPSGYISSVKDPQGRPTVIDLVGRDITERIYPVGRLDYDTEGLLILTNDGHFSQILQHPKNQIPRTYQVKVNGFPEKHLISKLSKGIVIEGKKTGKAKIKVFKKTKKNTWLEIVIREGRNRQIKKMFDAVGFRVLRIIRTAFGPLHLENVPAGSYRLLKKKEIHEIKKMADRDLP